MRSLYVCFALWVLPILAGCGTESVESGRRLGYTIKNSHELSQIAIYYIQYTAQVGQPPQNWEELKTFIGADGAGIARLVDEGNIVVVCGKKPSLQAIIAYQKNANENGDVLVVRGNRRVELVAREQLKQQLERW
ncbi:MAG: hypothetical protein KatS3mg105_4448 [Gemmatales bacterium]|nr:MAG: hypothetical protein KatS3mg105_4448 [Gemmatales bacterium]